MNQLQYSILRDFYKYSGPKLVTFGLNVGTNLDPTVYTNLKVSPTELKLQANDLSLKLAAMVTGGSAETAAKNAAFELLCSSLDDDANIVEVAVKYNLEQLLNTGYLPVSTSRTVSPLENTSIQSVENNGATSLLLRLTPVANARSYQIQSSTDNGKTWVEVTISTQARRIVLNNQVPGTTYMFRARAIGGSTGASDWANSGPIMCT